MFKMGQSMQTLLQLFRKYFFLWPLFDSFSFCLSSSITALGEGEVPAVWVLKQKNTFYGVPHVVFKSEHNVLLQRCSGVTLYNEVLRNMSSY